MPVFHALQWHFLYPSGEFWDSEISCEMYFNFRLAFQSQFYTICSITGNRMKTSIGNIALTHLESKDHRRTAHRMVWQKKHAGKIRIQFQDGYIVPYLRSCKYACSLSVVTFLSTRQKEAFPPIALSSLSQVLGRTGVGVLGRLDLGWSPELIVDWVVKEGKMKITPSQILLAPFGVQLLSRRLVHGWVVP